jgi:hypothetical protein
VGGRLSGRSGRSVGWQTLRLGRHRRSFARRGLGQPRTPRWIAAPRAAIRPPLHPTRIRDTSDSRLQPSASRGGRDPCLPHPEAGSAPSRSPLQRAGNARRGKTPVRPHLPPWTGIPGARRHHRPIPRAPPRAPRPRRSTRRPPAPPPPTRLGRRLRSDPRFPRSLSERGRLGGPPILGTRRSTAPGQPPGGWRRATDDSIPPRGPPRSQRMPGSRRRPVTPSARQRVVVSTPRFPGPRNDLRGLRPTRWRAASSIRRHPRPASTPPPPRGLATCGVTSTRPVAGPPINPRRLRQPCAVTWIPRRLGLLCLHRMSTATWVQRRPNPPNALYHPRHPRTAMRTRPGPGLFAVLRRWSQAGTCSATWTLQSSGRGRRRSGIRWRFRGPRSRFGGLFRDPRFGGRDPPAAVTARAATVRMAGPGGAAAGWCLLRRCRLRERGGGGSGSWRWC